MEKLVIIAFGLLIIQGLLTYFQIKSYQHKVKELKKYGIVGIGTEKGGLKAGNITILVSDSNGIIVRCEKMEGMTVFTRFKEVKGLQGLSIEKLKEDVENNKKDNGKKGAMLQAIESLETKLANRWQRKIVLNLPIKNGK